MYGYGSSTGGYLQGTDVYSLLAPPRFSSMHSSWVSTCLYGPCPCFVCVVEEEPHNTTMVLSPPSVRLLSSSSSSFLLSPFSTSFHPGASLCVLHLQEGGGGGTGHRRIERGGVYGQEGEEREKRQEEKRSRYPLWRRVVCVCGVRVGKPRTLRKLTRKHSTFPLLFYRLPFFS